MENFRPSLTKIPHEHVPKSHVITHVITRVITCDFGTCSCGIFVRVAFHIGSTSNLFIFQFVSQHCLRSTLRLFHYLDFNHTSSRSTWFSSGMRCYDPCRMICTRTRRYVNTRRALLRSITVLIKPFFIINVALGTIPLGARESTDISVNLLALYFQ